jgi:nitrogen fixation protein NifU and related proteins
MSALRELYQEVIIDHGRTPRNFSELSTANFSAEGFNPLCGDKIIVYLQIENEVIQDISFQGCGCAISTASASLMTESIKGKTQQQAKNLFENFHQLVTQENAEVEVGKLAILGGVREFPMRVKCATLAWHTLLAAFKNEKQLVSTE